MTSRAIRRINADAVAPLTPRTKEFSGQRIVSRITRGHGLREPTHRFNSEYLYRQCNTHAHPFLLPPAAPSILCPWRHADDPREHPLASYLAIAARCEQWDGRMTVQRSLAGASAARMGEFRGWNGPRSARRDSIESSARGVYPAAAPWLGHRWRIHHKDVENKRHLLQKAYRQQFHPVILCRSKIQ